MQQSFHLLGERIVAARHFRIIYPVEKASSRLLKKSTEQGPNREHSGFKESGTESNCGGNEFFNSLLVGRFDHSEGYKLFSLILASFVVNCHSATA